MAPWLPAFLLTFAPHAFAAEATHAELKASVEVVAPASKGLVYNSNGYLWTDGSVRLAVRTSKDSVPLRANPKPDAAVVAAIEVIQPAVTVTGKAVAGDWYPVTVDGKSGYMSGQLLAFDPPGAGPPGDGETRRARTKSRSVRLREKPSLEARVLATIEVVQPTVNVTGPTVEGGWYPAIAERKMGYIARIDLSFADRFKEGKEETRFGLGCSSFVSAVLSHVQTAKFAEQRRDGEWAHWKPGEDIAQWYGLSLERVVPVAEFIGAYGKADRMPQGVFLFDLQTKEGGAGYSGKHTGFLAITGGEVAQYQFNAISIGGRAHDGLVAGPGFDDYLKTSSTARAPGARLKLFRVSRRG